MRDRLPNRRQAEHYKVEFQGVHYHVTLGRYADGRIGEVFVKSEVRVGSQVQALLDDACVWLSLLLQSGVSPDALSRGSEDGGAPSSVLGLAVDLIRCAEQDRMIELGG